MFIAFALIIAGPTAPPAAPPPDAHAVRLLVPAYVYPSADPKSAEAKYWDAIIAAAGPDCPIVAVLNPASGPIDREHPETEAGRIADYTALLTRAAKNEHLRFVMYAPLARLKTQEINKQREWVVRADATDDIDAWLKHYPPAKYPNLIGFFLDEHPAFDATQLAAARKVSDYASTKLKGATVFLNVGRADGAAVLAANRSNEVAILWEKPDAANLRDTFALPAWAEEKVKGTNSPVFPRQRFCVLVHSKPALRDDFVPLVTNPAPAGKGVGWLYATDAGGANPWGRLPKYWGETVKAVQAQNTAKK